MVFNDVLSAAKEKNVLLLSKENACTFLHFMFYPPTALSGPIFTYGDFKKSVSFCFFEHCNSAVNRLDSLLCCLVISI